MVLVDSPEPGSGEVFDWSLAEVAPDGVRLLLAGGLNPDNVEVLVKVLDACSTSSHRFWVFAAGLTNLESNLIVTDTVTGAFRVYTNPSGTP